MKLRSLLILMVVSISPLWISAQSLRGTVKDERGEPIIGATVKVDGTTEGIITDLNGVFVLDHLAKPSITVSYIGFCPRRSRYRASQMWLSPWSRMPTR